MDCGCFLLIFDNKAEKEYNESNTLVPLYDNEDAVCGIVYNDVPYYFLKNQQGDIIAITDANATVVARYTYDAWGVPTVTQDTTTVGIATLNPYRYRGYYYDVETELYYLQSRYYDPMVGRFVNGDDVEVATFSAYDILEKNIFIYAANALITLYDPYGFKPINITEKLTKLMRKNAVAFFLRIIMQVFFRGVIDGLTNSIIYFYHNVKTGGLWDLKNQGWVPNGQDWYVFKGRKLRNDDPGNIHFGYVGSVMFPPIVLRAGAGAYQIYTRTSSWTFFHLFLMILEILR